MQQKVRDSQFELLRIIAMAMIVMVHFNGVAVETFLPVTNCRFADVWGAEFLEAFAIVGVNLFVLISGYFGIRLTARGTARYVGWVLWYSILIYLIFSCFYPKLFLPKYTQYAVFGISHTSQWFVRSYFFLMVLSPIINGVLRRTSFREHAVIVAVLLAVNCYFGWWLGCVFNDSGYTVYHMVLIYCIGAFVRECLTRYAWLRSRALLCGIYLCSLLAVVFMMQSMRYFQVISYNNPVVLLESVALFALFTTFHFKSRAINWLASSAFAVYLIHMHFSIYPHLLRPLLLDTYKAHGGVEYAIIATGIGVAMYVACILIDKPREWLFDKVLSFRKDR